MFLRGWGLFKQTHKSWGRGYSFVEAFRGTAHGRRGLSTWSQAWGLCLPPPHLFGLIFIFFCHQYPELLVASYNNNEDAPHEPDGVALVWNMKYKKATPEYVFHCQVLKAPLLVSPTPPRVLAFSMTSVELCQPTPVCSPLALLLLLCPHAPYPPAFMHIVSSPYWHPATPHLSTNTCSWGAGEDVWCRTRVQAMQQD